jgi:hypothetical protein
VTNDDVGHGRPPKASRFKPGVSGNPKGRPKRKPAAIAEAINKAFDEPISYVDGGRQKVTTRGELALLKWVELAVKGEVVAADHILKIREQALRGGNTATETIRIRDWLSDFPGQTAEQKTQSIAAAKDGDPPNWWEATQATDAEDAEHRRRGGSLPRSTPEPAK